MRSFFNDLTTLARLHLTIATAALGVMIAALGTYLRQQLRSAITWALGPITEHLPWNREGFYSPPHQTDEPALLAELTIVDIFLLTSDGAKAKYQKTSNYLVMKGELHSYKEGVTSAGNVTRFTTRRGLITSTDREHGFFVSKIDLGNLLSSGARFTNVFSAELQNSFTSSNEHWTQEIAIPTKHLILQIHFPKDRAPLLVKCKHLVGLIDRRVATTADVLESADGKLIVWDLENPQINDVYKLEWVW